MGSPDFKSVRWVPSRSPGWVRLPSAPANTRQIRAESGHKGSSGSFPIRLVNKSPEQIVDKFLSSRRQGTSPRTIEFYKGYLGLSKSIIGLNVTGDEISSFLNQLACSNGGKHAYFRVLRAFYNWLYSPKSRAGLQASSNPMLGVDSPKVEKKILPSLTPAQVEYLVQQAETLRDRAIISLMTDSGLRLSEIANINPHNIDWSNRLIKVRVKGNKEGLAPFGARTEALLKSWGEEFHHDGRLWDLSRGGIIAMLRRLSTKTGLPCNPHTFRRTFASILAKGGTDSLHIMRLGRWESLAMVERYTRSVKFEDSLKFYKAPLS